MSEILARADLVSSEDSPPGSQTVPSLCLHPQAGARELSGVSFIRTLICRLHHPHGRKQRGTKEPPDEAE